MGSQPTTSIPAACSSMGFPSIAPGPSRPVCTMRNTKHPSKGLAAHRHLRQQHPPQQAWPPSDGWSILGSSVTLEPASAPCQLLFPPKASCSAKPEGDASPPCSQVHLVFNKALLILAIRPKERLWSHHGCWRPGTPKQHGRGSPPGTIKVSEQPPGHLRSPQPGHLIDRAISPRLLFPLIKSVFSNRERKVMKCFLLSSFSPPHKPLVAPVSLLQARDPPQPFKPSPLLEHRTLSINPLSPLPHYPITHPSSCASRLPQNQRKFSLFDPQTLEVQFLNSWRQGFIPCQKKVQPLVAAPASSKGFF